MDCSYIKSKKEMWYVSIILLMNKKVNAKRIASAKFGKAKNKEIALTNNLFLAFPAGIEPTVYRLGGDCVIRLRYGKIYTF